MLCLCSGDDGSGSEAGDATPEREPPAEHPEPKAASDDNDSSIDAEVRSTCLGWHLHNE